MRKPEMILFDYGNTLLCEPEFDFLRGEEAVLKLVKGRPLGLGAAQVSEFNQKLFRQLSAVRDLGYEIQERQLMRFAYEYLGLELSVSYEEAEIIFWRNISPGEIMPGADRMIDCVNEMGIRCGVISNAAWSEAAMRERINRLLPHNKFEFIIVSSEYAIRKPNPMLFGLALRKAGLPADKVWFCGDSVKYDVEGASSAGIFPVWYADKTRENHWRETDETEKPQCEHLHVNSWREFINILEGLN